MGRIWGWGDAGAGGQGGSRPASAILLGALLLGVVALQGVDQRPPAPAGREAPASEYSAARAMDVLEVIAAAPHAVGQSDHGAARDHLIRVLQDQVEDVHVQSSTVAGHPTVYNIVARVPGTAGPDADTILAVAHYDSVHNAPGAADDGVGTVAVVEAARAIDAGPPLRNDVVFLLTDGEEQGLWGAEAFVSEHPLAAEVDLVLNFESGGPRGPNTLLEVDRATPEMLRTYFDAVPRPSSMSLLDDMVAAARSGRVADTDFTQFRRLGKPGFNFANAMDTGYRHTPGDVVGLVDPATVQHQGATLVGLIRAYGDIDLDGVGGDADASAVWVSLFSWLPLAWSHGVAWVLLAIVALLLGVLAHVVVGARGGRPGAVARSFGSTFGAMGAAVLSSLLLVGFLWVVRPDHRPHFNGILPRTRFPSIGPPESELYWFGGLGLACGVAVLVLSGTRRKVELRELVLGANLACGFLALLTMLGLPGASHLFVLPLLVVVPTNLWLFTRGEERLDTWTAWAVVAAGAVAVVVVGAQVLVYFRQFHVSNVTLMAPFAALFVAQLLPAIEVVAAGDRRLPLVGTAGIGSLLLALGLVTIDAAPVMHQDEYVGVLADPEVASAPVELPAASPWDLERVDFASGRTCVRATGPNEVFTWCALPADVAPPVDVQQIGEGDRALLFGQAPTGTALVRVVHATGVVEVAATDLEGVPGRFFAGVVLRALGDVEQLVAVDADGTVLARRDGFPLPDGTGWDRVKGPSNQRGIRSG